MKKTFILILLISTIFLSGCGLFNLNGWVIPDDKDFLEVVESLDTPEKIVNYMYDNFEVEMHAIYTPDPYILWVTKKGDCNDFSTFAVFVANYHGYKTYQVTINNEHAIAIYKEEGKYTFSSSRKYYPAMADTLKECVLSHPGKINSYKIYDYDNKLIEEGK